MSETDISGISDISGTEVDESETHKILFRDLVRPHLQEERSSL